VSRGTWARVCREPQNVGGPRPNEPLGSNPRRRPAEPSQDELLARAVLRLNSNILGLVIGILAGFSIFVATNWLVIKGGEQVGPHLSLLGQYFIGYRVSFVGSLIGTIYGFVVGYIAGRLIGAVYNFVVDVRVR
jgi:hypothetical protein